MASPRRVHQIVDVAVPGDAIFNCMLDFQAFLVERGYESRLYARHYSPALRGRVAHYRDLDGTPSDHVLLYHFGAGSDLTPYLQTRHDRLVLSYHNMTPPEYYRVADPLLASYLERGQTEIAALRDQVVLALADSQYNRRDLEALGYRNVRVLPPAHLGDRLAVPPDATVRERFGDGRTNVLFVGRLAPNKRQEDLIKLFYHYRPIDPTARLLLVGAPDGPGVYHQWLVDLAKYLELADVHFSGHVSQTELNAYYQTASVFVCLSDHEGFGVPLIESMHFGLPVVALASSAVPETLGNAGVLVQRRDYLLLAELIRLLVTDTQVREAVLAAQAREVTRFSRDAVRDLFWSHLGPVLEGG